MGKLSRCIFYLLFFIKIPISLIKITPWFLITSRGFFMKQIGPSAHKTTMKKINCDFGKEKNGNAKLTQEQVLELRHLRETEGYSERSLAAMFGICKTHAHRIIHNLSWA